MGHAEGKPSAQDAESGMNLGPFLLPLLTLKLSRSPDISILTHGWASRWGFYWYTERVSFFHISHAALVMEDRYDQPSQFLRKSFFQVPTRLIRRPATDEANSPGKPPIRRIKPALFLNRDRSFDGSDGVDFRDIFLWISHGILPKAEEPLSERT